jgi:arginyl-tRNA synthetase
VYPPNPEMGDISLPSFEVAKELKQNPKEFIDNLISKIKPDKIIIGVKSVGPYLNFVINKEYLINEVVNEIIDKKEKFGNNDSLKKKKIMIEYAHPNPFKSFHIGHLRNIILGESIARIIESQGAEVVRVNYQGDVGMHIAKCIWAFQKIDSKKYPETADEKVALLGKCYAEGAKAFEEDQIAKQLITYINKQIYEGKDKNIKKLWELGKKWSLEKFHEIYKRLDTHFEREYMESEVTDEGLKQVEKALNKNILEKSDGAVVFNGKKYDLDTRVFLNSEGLPTYEGKELGLAMSEFNDFGKIDLCIHNVAIEQISFFKVTFKVEELLDEKKYKDKQYHNAYEFVGLKSGKMSSRKGQVILGNDIMNQAVLKIEEKTKNKDLSNIEELYEKIAVGAVKYSFLKISPFKYLAFDLDESVSFEGDSGPYLLYTYARIQSIFRKADSKKLKAENLELLTNAKESNLVLKIAKYGEIVEKAALKYDPSEIAKYVFELSKEFNDYYHNVQILNVEENLKSSRLAMIDSIGQVIKNSLNLLGIDVVDEM